MAKLFCPQYIDNVSPIKLPNYHSIHKNAPYTTERSPPHQIFTFYKDLKKPREGTPSSFFSKFQPPKLPSFRLCHFADHQLPPLEVVTSQAATSPSSPRLSLSPSHFLPEVMTGGCRSTMTNPTAVFFTSFSLSVLMAR